MKISGVHHIAFCTNDMKSQIEFFTQVVGMKLVGLFPMHGTEGATHCFLESGENCYLSFIQMPGPGVSPVMGVSHALDASHPVAGGAMQHISFNVDSFEELMDLRDRLRSNGYAVVGPLDHMISHSMYLGAPEGILLEFSTSEGCTKMTAAAWTDLQAAQTVGIELEDLKRFASPPAFAGHRGAVAQPDPTTAIYPTPIPRPMYEAVAELSDADIQEVVRYDPPEGVDLAA
ncbi:MULTISPECIES: VOC family protein [Sphingomonadales]|uniref:VOC domain-containing protein n=2 Tax=Sphingomonadaceae TaxID=41297 RepID=T0H928_9SPHN|nr:MULTISPECIES: VOC family protein [Sphingomonadaceae]EQB09542.1 hypothetical protein L284_19585 [Novosphingobium lindaniclasticum LE124]EQB11127.1 hypothetical protein RLDS_24855 [Sphingobium lactosutens DS20]